MNQSALHAAGVQAQRIEWLWWVMLAVTGVVFLIVMLVLAVALRRARRAVAPPPHATQGDAHVLNYVTAATVLTVIVLFGLLISSMVVGRAIARQDDEIAMIVEVTANQWWWNVEYQHPEPEQRVRTANELHLPVGRTVQIKLLASDVIHSFWVPQLHGKMDAIPGHSAEISLRVDRPGIYRGQCAEFCGAQHAHMAFVVIAEPPDDFERWIQAQRQTAREPDTEQARRGRQIVQAGPCVMCHTVRGTAAAARRAPDLTHFFSRASIAAGTLPMSRLDVIRWLADPQAIKPGSRMPRIALSDADRDAVAAYLEQLK
jgi:cytochrome c oxidase subunit 2